MRNAIASLVLLSIVSQNHAHATDQFPGATWTTATPAEVGMDAAKLAQALSTLNGNVAVVRFGKLAGIKGDITYSTPLYSVGKSITSSLFGVLMYQGSVDYTTLVPGSNYPTSPFGTYRDFMRMTSDYGLSPHTPGSRYAYNNKAVDHYGESLRPHFGNKSPLQILDQHLFGILGRQDPINFGGLWGGWGGGFATSARDLARIGLLVLRNGTWSGQQILSPSFIADLFKSQIPASAVANWSFGVGSPTQGPNGDNWWNQHQITGMLKGNYSYGWWTNASNRYPQLPLQTIWADGLGGNYIILCPQYDLIVTTTLIGNNTNVQNILKPILDAVIDAPPAPGVLSGELKQWHRVTLTFDGPPSSEGNAPNPFTDYRLDVTFTHPNHTFTVPGYYCADGNAGETGSASGNKWRVHFTPIEAGTWTYVATFRSGALVAATVDPMAGAPFAFDGATASFFVSETDKTGTDHRGKGILRHTGERYLAYEGTGEPFLVSGAASPENLLAYQGFDQTTPTHVYAPHAADWTLGDPDWKSGQGRNLIGALNYLASEGMNSVALHIMTSQGASDDVWPWVSKGQVFRFDCSKLDQWEIVFEHMDRLGIHMQLVLQEDANDQWLDGGNLGLQRTIFLREMVARFSHHLGLTWNLGEENTNTDQQRQAFADFIRALDAYEHPIVVHTRPGQIDQVYNPLLGDARIEGASMNISSSMSVNGQTRKWVDLSTAASEPWFVLADEVGPTSDGALPDALDPGHDGLRKEVLWGNLMAGGAGVHWYFGTAWTNGDLDCEDWRSRDSLWDQARHAQVFFKKHLPFNEMVSANSLVTAVGALAFAKPGATYAIYLPSGGSSQIDLQSNAGPFLVRWYDPCNGGELQIGSTSTINGPGMTSIGQPPSNPTKDWAVIVTKPTAHVGHYGKGVVGTSGIAPEIDAFGDPAIGNMQFGIQATWARKNALALFTVGGSAANLPIFGGAILNDLLGGAYFMTTDGNGSVVIDIPLGLDVSLVGFSGYCQWLIQDAAAVGGVSMTKGLTFKIHN